MGFSRLSFFGGFIFCLLFPVSCNLSLVTVRRLGRSSDSDIVEGAGGKGLSVCRERRAKGKHSAGSRLHPCQFLQELMPRKQAKKPSFGLRYPCRQVGCPRTFRSIQGQSYHFNTFHRNTNTIHVRSSTPHASPSGSDILHNDFPMLPQDDVREPSATPPRRSSKQYHPFLNAEPCDEHGNKLPEGTPPPARTVANPEDWSPYEDEIQFKTADFLFRIDEMSQTNINILLELWALQSMKHGHTGPFENYKEIYDMIDASSEGDAPWKCMKTTVPDDLPSTAPSWKKKEYEIWFRDPDVVLSNMLANPDFDGEFDTTPYVEVDADGERRWSDFMSANFAWRQCDRIYEEDPTTKGAMYVAGILGSDKTTVSVATGDVEYHPFYISPGFLRNNVRRGHRQGVIPIGFFAIPKSDRKYDNDPEFRKFKRQLFHSSISAILSPLKVAMKTPVIRRCPDGHFRRIIYDLGPFIADYPEQVMLTGIVQGWCPRCTSLSNKLDPPSGPRRHDLTETLLEQFTGTQLWDEFGIDEDIVPFTCDFPRADIHELISSDLLHQVIKGTFKDHLVTWVGEYLELEHGRTEADRILDEIDRRIAATPSFPALRRFKQGRRFKQWTGDDSKALMKIYLPAIVGFIPDDVIKCLGAFLDFCYIARRSDFDEKALNNLDTALAQFHVHREIFRTTGVREENGFNLPRQHSLVHFRRNIEDFGALNGICSSITESRHITAVKKPWRRSSRFEALGQMLITNQRLDKLAATKADFISRGMLPPERPSPLRDKDEGEDGEPVDGEQVLGNVVLARTRERSYPRKLEDLATHIGIPTLPQLIHYFLTDQLTPDEEGYTDEPTITSPIYVFHSATATFYAPSDPSGLRGMRRERIRSTPSWRGTGKRHDCAFVVEDESKLGFRGMSAVRILLLFSFTHDDITYPCALVEWFKKVGRSPDNNTGMWVVAPEYKRNGDRLTTVIHLDSVLRAAHLIPVYGRHYLPPHFPHTWSLDAFEAFYVNKYADHHANEICF